MFLLNDTLPWCEFLLAVLGNEDDYTPNANMADHSVGARDEYESVAVVVLLLKRR